MRVVDKLQEYYELVSVYAAGALQEIYSALYKNQYGTVQEFKKFYSFNQTQNHDFR